MRNSSYLLLLLCLTLIVGCTTALVENEPSKVWIVRYGDNPTYEQLLARVNAAKAQGLQVRSIYFATIKGFSVSANAESIRAMGDIDAAFFGLEPKPPATLERLACSPVSQAGEKEPWGVHFVGTPSTNLSGKRVWIVDSGVDIENEDLTIDTRKQGNFIRHSGLCALPNPFRSVDDTDGHGTHVAATVAAKKGQPANMPVGIFGVAPGMTVVPIKVVESSDTSIVIDDAICALQYVELQARNGDIVNLSWRAVRDHDLDDQVRALVEKAHLKVVAAAGNDAMDATGYSPARLGGYAEEDGGFVITTAAIDAGRNFWTASANRGSNWGDPSPNYAEPGVDIVSYGSDGRLYQCTGTSLAAAHMSGILLRGVPKFDGMRASGDTDGNADPIATCCR